MKFCCTFAAAKVLTAIMTIIRMFNFTPPPYTNVAYGRLVNKNIVFRNA